MSRILCWFGWHDWRFTLNFVQEPTFDSTADMYPVGHYSGKCKRCGKRDLFRGPAPDEKNKCVTIF